MSCPDRLGVGYDHHRSFHNHCHRELHQLLRSSLLSKTSVISEFPSDSSPNGYCLLIGIVLLFMLHYLEDTKTKLLFFCCLGTITGKTKVLFLMFCFFQDIPPNGT